MELVHVVFLGKQASHEQQQLCGLVQQTLVGWKDLYSGMEREEMMEADKLQLLLFSADLCPEYSMDVSACFYLLDQVRARIVGEGQQARLTIY